jgi:hypothetical protein
VRKKAHLDAKMTISHTKLRTNKYITMTLESDRPERGSDDRHNTPTYGASGALPPFRETYLPGEARDLLPVRTHNRIRSPR